MPRATRRSSPSTRNSFKTIELCNRILSGAVDAGASFVHIEPTPDGLAVRYRVGIFLNTIMTVPARRAGAIRNRYKMLAGTKVGERKRPQEGTFMLRVNGRPVGVELITAPTMNGEKIVMRVIDMRGVPAAIHSPAFDGPVAASLLQASDYSNVIHLVTESAGPEQPFEGPEQHPPEHRQELEADRASDSPRYRRMRRPPEAPAVQRLAA